MNKNKFFIMIPPWLNFDNECNYQGEILPAAIAIGLSGKQWHVGILHRNNNNISFLHLAGHNKLLNDPPYPDFAWILIKLPVERIRQVAGMCRRIWKKKELGEVPYSFRFEDSKFKKTGELLLGETEYGLTCATFVLAVFKSVGIHLLKIEEWQKRNSDLEWQKKIIDYLKRVKQKHEKKAQIFIRQSEDFRSVEYHRESSRKLGVHINNIT